MSVPEQNNNAGVSNLRVGHVTIDGVKFTTLDGHVQCLYDVRFRCGPAPEKPEETNYKKVGCDRCLAIYSRNIAHHNNKILNELLSGIRSAAASDMARRLFPPK